MTLIHIGKAFSEGQFIRAPGSDISKGELVLHKNQLINSSEIGTLATLGHLKVNVVRSVIVGLLSTGNELVSFYQEIVASGKIRDSNKIMLIQLITTLNCQIQDLGSVGDSGSEID